MANCNNLFQEFNRTIRLDDDRRIKLRERRNNLRERINNGFTEVKKNQPLNEEIEFQSQGSYVMDTIINPCRVKDEYDIDDGVYFLGTRSGKQRPEPQAFHDFIVAAINQGKGQNKIEEVIDKDTCVRVRYKGENGDFNYHVDIPIYYAVDPREPDLADKKKNWHTSSPVDFIVWFEKIIKSGFKAEYILERRLYSDEYQKWLDDRRKKDHQLRRIVRYLKAWADCLDNDMPPGIVMTVLAGSDSNYVEDSQDDISLRGTLLNIRGWLNNNGFTCPRPTTTVGEDLFEGYSFQRKENFRRALDSFIESANQAVESVNQKDACLKWQRHLGERFPCFLAKDEIEGAKTYKAAPVIRSDNSKSA